MTDSKQIPGQAPELKPPSTHVVAVHAAFPGNAVLVHDSPDCKADVQSPRSNAFGRSFEASQFSVQCGMRWIKNIIAVDSN